VTGAARLAEDFLKRQGAWSGAPDAATGRMLRVERMGGLIDDAELHRARRAFLEDFTRQSSRVRFVRGVTWLNGYAAMAETEEDAQEALRELPAWAPVPVGLRTSFNDEALGHTDLLAGRIDEAAVHLARAARMCDALDDPFRHVRVQLLLGRALEAKGDTTGACAAYGEVLTWWGAAKPRSVTAEQAKERRTRLACRG
jgi:serine/threonine-protein kinase